MTYAEPLSNQVLMFIRSIGPGVIIGILYDVIFSFFRAISHKRFMIITADLIFSITATLISFFYMVIYNSGTVRLNIIAAQFIGAVAFHLTMGKYVAKVTEFVAKIIGKIITLIFSPFVFVSRKLTSKLSIIREKIKPKRKTYPKEEVKKKKIMNILKIHLKN